MDGDSVVQPKGVLLRPEQTTAEIRVRHAEEYGFERGGAWAGYSFFTLAWAPMPGAVPRPTELLTRIAEEYCRDGWEAVCTSIQPEVSDAENVGYIKNDDEKKAFCVGFACAMRGITGDC